ncbi:MAG: hypothetical protein Q8O56_10740, partial [Solirubrobacteraceae bacterium]|nr:hypothetical protein [Solirubrobacteraceae bacterium]
MLDATRTSPRRIALVLVTTLMACVVCVASTGEALAATSFSVEVRPATGGTTAAPAPITIAVRASFAGDAPGTLPAALRGLTIAMPDGFARALAGTTPCARADLAGRGPAACPASSRLGSGSASFVYVTGALRIPASTDELSLFRGPGDTLLMYLRVTQPATLAIVVPGALTARPAPAGPLITFDLSAAAQVAGGGSVVVTRAAFDLRRGLAAGPCNAAGHWTFRARLAFAGGGGEERSADARCEQATDTTAPVLRATARNGTPALGARFAIRLSEPARVHVTLERRAGRRWASVRRATFRAGTGSTTLRI